MRKVKRRIKSGKMPSGSNPYAICTAAMKRSSSRIRSFARAANPIPMGHGAIEGVKWKPLLVIVGAAVAVGAAVVLAAQPAPAAQQPAPQPAPKPQPPPGVTAQQLDVTTIQALNGAPVTARFSGYIASFPNGYEVDDPFFCFDINALLSLYTQYPPPTYVIFWWPTTVDSNGSPCP